MVMIYFTRILNKCGELSPSSACKLLLYQQLRHASNRPNLKRPRPPHFNRIRMLTVCEPVYPPKPKNCFKEAMTMKKLDNPVEDNPYAVFLAGKMRRDFTSHPLAVIRGALYDMKYEMDIQETINRNVARMALTGTKWAPILPLFRGRTALGFCSSDSIPKLQKALKKMPQFVLIGALAHGRILHKDAVEELAKLKDITNVRAQLTSTFALQSVTLSQNLSANINALSHSLATFAKPPTEEKEDTSSSSSSSSSDGESDSDSSSSSDSDSDKKEK